MDRETKFQLKRALLATTVVLTILWRLTVASAGGQTRPAPAPLMSEEFFKNVQVLKQIPVDEFLGAMGFYSAATGLNCTDCHVEESGGSWARYADESNLKRTARRMQVMVNAINQTNFGGRQVVTCNTCHRGTNRPNVMPSLAALYGSPPPDEPGEPFSQATSQPSAADILEKYLQASGGTQRLAALTSLTARGTVLGFGDADKSPVEIFANARGQRTTVVHSRSGNSTTTYDGRAGWIAAPLIEKPVPLLTVTGHDLEGMRLEAAVFFPARIKEALSNWRVGLPATLGDREVLLVQGTSTTGGTATLCIDTRTGLLVRLVHFAESPVGRFVTQIDYTDHRELAGVTLPFRWTVSKLNGRFDYEMTAVQPNAPIDGVHFAQPPPSGSPAGR